MILQILLSVICVLLFYFYYIYKRIHHHFDVCGLKYLPGVPIFGNILRSTFLRRHFVYDLEEVYKAFPDERYVGFVDGMVPVILVRDPEIMKDITVKDFDHFQNRKEFFPERLDPLLGRDLIQLRNEEWKTTRMQMTPAFTAARLRYMMPIMINVCKRVIDSMKSKVSTNIELRESMYKYTGDCIIAAAFGIDQEKAGGEDSLFSSFGQFCRAVIKTQYQQKRGFEKTAKNFLVFTNYHLFTKRTDNFLRKTVHEALKYREENNLSVPDYMDVLLKMAPGRTLDDLAGQFFFSYAASLESSSGVLRLCFHELALNPVIQERLYQEIKKHEEGGGMSVEGIKELKYLDCVFNETSRKWSAAVMMDRVCTKPYILPPPREGAKPYQVEPGNMVFNVVNAVHMNPKYFPNPDVFDPERFSEENKKTMTPFTFQPFGTGPRGCLGARFATLQVKMMMYLLLLSFQLVKCEGTSDPIQLEPDEFNMGAAGGTWVRLELRQ